MNAIEVTVPDSRADMCPPPSELESLARRVLGGEDLDWSWIGIVLADHEHVTALNRQYLDHDFDTDVLSFLLSEDGPVEGEVYVDLDTAVERCEEFDSTPDEEIRRYVVHGLLHLAGYDDSTDAQRDTMRRLEDRYLAGD